MLLAVVVVAGGRREVELEALTGPPVPLATWNNIDNNNKTTPSTAKRQQQGQQQEPPPRVTPRQTTKDPK